jgi:hypothetical protein
VARRRVFETKVECPGISVAQRLQRNELTGRWKLIGRAVTLEKSSSTGVNITLDGTVVGHLDAVVGHQVSLAIDRGQSFTAVIKNAYQIEPSANAPTWIDLKVEYLLDKDQPAIVVPKAPVEPHAARSFFTTVAGVSHEGRQQIVARCSVGESLILIRDPNNRFDKGAIKVVRLDGEQLGFIPAHVSRGGDSSGLAFQMDKGTEYQCRIKNITGGGPGESLGVNIEITTAGEKFDDVPQIDGSRVTPATPGARAIPTSVHPALLWILAVLIIGFILWAASK